MPHGREVLARNSHQFTTAGVYQVLSNTRFESPCSSQEMIYGGRIESLSGRLSKKGSLSPYNIFLPPDGAGWSTDLPLPRGKTLPLS